MLARKTPSASSTTTRSRRRDGQHSFSISGRSTAWPIVAHSFDQRTARQARTQQDAIFCVRTAALIEQIHEGEKPLARVATIEDFPDRHRQRRHRSGRRFGGSCAASTSGAAQFTNDDAKARPRHPAKPQRLSSLSLDKFGHHGYAKSWRNAVIDGAGSTRSWTAQVEDTRHEGL